METCDLHEDCVVVYDSDVSCPICKLERRSAAAPKLLAACRDMVECMEASLLESGRSGLRDYKTILAAIAKAEKGA